MQAPKSAKKNRQSRRGNPYTRIVLVVAALIGIFVLLHHRDEATADVLQSGFQGYCLDVQKNKTTPDAAVDLWKCNHSSAQVWTAAGLTLVHNKTTCLTMQADHAVTASTCNGDPTQVWLRSKGGFLNPNSGLCLNAGQQKSGAAVTTADCGNLSTANGTWTPAGASGQALPAPTCGGSEGQKIACYAAKEWTAWQADDSNHEALLGTYSNGAPYEEWCADFVSYVYKEAGYPFTRGESDGWDENVADNVQNMGFTRHDAGTGYVPKPGDVAYFNYSGGHVEIVVSGGAHPTFVYGNSGTTDPATGNGQMAANTITSDPSEGYLVYYLSPNS